MRTEVYLTTKLCTTKYEDNRSRKKVLWAGLKPSGGTTNYEANFKNS